jgi:hypothetical protein
LKIRKKWGMAAKLNNMFEKLGENEKNVRVM